MKKSGGKEKFNMLLDDFVNLDFFQGWIRELREKYGIPAAGLELSEADRAKMKQYGYIHKPEKFQAENAVIKKINEDIGSLALRFFAPSISVKSFFKIYLFYNVCANEVLKTETENLLKVVDLDDQYWDLTDDDLADEWSDGKTRYLNAMQAENAHYPIAIRIHPLASQRDLIAYVQKNWGLIHCHQLKYRSAVKGVFKINDVRARDVMVKQRNQFIYENRDKPIKTIRKILAKQGHFLDDGLIGKVISLKRKKRKQVPFA